jgi:hypothetical protein
MGDNMNHSEIGCEDTVYKLVGFDKDGHRRVRGCDYTKSGAQEQCIQEAVKYVRGQPDTGPLSAWTFHWR